jgi:hypothetical protein
MNIFKILFSILAFIFSIFIPKSTKLDDSDLRTGDQSYTLDIDNSLPVDSDDPTKGRYIC